MTDAAVEVLEEADRQRGIASLTLAFATDPVMRWGWPDPHRYFTYWPMIADAFGGGAIEHGTAYGLEGCLAVALWLPPGGEPDGETVMGLMRESMDDQTFEDINGVFEQMDEHHPTTDHWYLPLTGVDPSAQGRRLGSDPPAARTVDLRRPRAPRLPGSNRSAQSQPLCPSRLQRRRCDPGRFLAAHVGDDPRALALSGERSINGPSGYRRSPARAAPHWEGIGPRRDRAGARGESASDRPSSSSGVPA